MRAMRCRHMERQLIGFVAEALARACASKRGGGQVRKKQRRQSPVSEALSRCCHRGHTRWQVTKSAASSQLNTATTISPGKASMLAALGCGGLGSSVKESV